MEILNLETSAVNRVLYQLNSNQQSLTLRLKVKVTVLQSITTEVFAAYCHLIKYLSIFSTRKLCNIFNQTTFLAHNNMVLERTTLAKRLF